MEPKKIPLKFPYKMALSNMPAHRFMLTMGHMFIAFNALLYFVGIFPAAGIFLALIFFSISSLKKNIFSEGTVRFSFRRLILAVIMIMVIYLINIETGKPLYNLWVVLLFIQLPLSLNDAYNIYHGKIGITMLK